MKEPDRLSGDDVIDQLDCARRMLGRFGVEVFRVRWNEVDRERAIRAWLFGVARRDFPPAQANQSVDSIERMIAAERAVPIGAGLRATMRGTIAGTRVDVGGRVALAGKILAVFALAAGTGLIVKSTPPAEPTGELKPIAHVEPWELTHVVPDPISVDDPEPINAERLASATTAKPARGVSAASQVRVLQQSRDGVARDPTSALALREALTILALSNLGRSDEARAAAELFDQAHPASIHRALVTRALQGNTP